MRTSFSAPRQKPLKTVASVAAHLALVTLIVTLFTTHGLVTALAAAITIGLLVGSYLLERWARRRIVRPADGHPRPVPTREGKA